MIDALIAGKLQGVAQQRSGSNGNVFTTAKVRAAGSDGETMFVNVIAFAEAAGAALMALEDGDSLALTGSMKVKTWTDRQGNAKPSLDLIAAQVLTPYHVKRKRNAIAAGTSSPAHGDGFSGDHDEMDF